MVEVSLEVAMVRERKSSLHSDRDFQVLYVRVPKRLADALRAASARRFESQSTVRAVPGHLRLNASAARGL